MIKSVGEMSLTEANDMNVPVGIFICEPEDGETAWTLMADNYWPRKSRVNPQQYEYHADTREELMALVQQYIVPLYECALSRLKTVGDLYYWNIEKD